MSTTNSHTKPVNAPRRQRGSWDVLRSTGAFGGGPVLVIVSLAAVAYAGIPVPSAVLHGQAVLDGIPIRATDDVAIIARVGGVAEAVGMYEMGDIPGAVDNYVLRLRIESQGDGAPQSNNAARVGQTAELFIRAGNGPERAAGQYVMVSSGVFVEQNLSASAPFGQCADEGGGIDLADAAAFGACLSGPDSSKSLPCGCADGDADLDADLADWAALQLSFTGSP